MVKFVSRCEHTCAGPSAGDRSKACKAAQVTGVEFRAEFEASNARQGGSHELTARERFAVAQNVNAVRLSANEQQED
jgi:hypothetical protein